MPNGLSKPGLSGSRSGLFFICYNLFTFSRMNPLAALRCINEVNNMAEVLILEMDERLGAQMLGLLTQAGHRCRLCQTIPEAEEHLDHPEKMYVVMNARLPWAMSHSFLNQAAQKGWAVLFLTEDASHQAHLEALYPGMSRVLARPWTLRQLAQRLDDLIEASRENLSYGSLQINLTDKQVTLEGRPLTLTAQEFALLEALMKHPERALSREHLLRTAWGYQGIGETRTVDVHVQRLRKKLGVDRIETVYKLGYRLRMA